MSKGGGGHAGRLILSKPILSSAFQRARIKGMSLYARPGKVLAKQVLSDIATIVWIFVWVVIAIALRRVIETLATPAQKLSDLASSMAGNMSDAASSVQDVPLVGDKLREPFDSMSTGFTSLQEYADSLAHYVQVTALVAAIVVFAVPVAIWLWKWLTYRIRYAYESSHATRLLAADGAIELFAMRAMATAPLSQLARVTTNPIYAWQTGDAEVMRKLADVELRREGLKLPKRSQGVSKRSA